MLKYKIIKEIDDGLSKDTKYIVLINKKKYLLRISDFNNSKMFTYKIIKEIYNIHNISKLYSYYNLDNKIYAFFNYIDGEPLKQLFPNLNENEKYNYGVQAGNLLRLLHSKKNKNLEIKISNNEVVKCIINNYDNFSLKNNIINKLYNYCKKILVNIDLNKYSFLNADFHSMNMIINNKNLFLIDLEKYEYGDPTRDFTFIYTFDEDRIYANGIINSYHCFKTIPENFWYSFKFFSALYIIQYYMWNINKFNEIGNSIDIATKFLCDYNGSSNKPNWYFKKDVRAVYEK